MIRTLFAILVVSVYLFSAGPLSILYVLLGGNPKILYSVGRTGCSLIIRLTGIKVDIRGLGHVKPERTYLFLANHQGNCDPPAVFPASLSHCQADAGCVTSKAIIAARKLRLPRAGPSGGWTIVLREP